MGKIATAVAIVSGIGVLYSIISTRFRLQTALTNPENKQPPTRHQLSHNPARDPLKKAELRGATQYHVSDYGRSTLSIL
jgi:hypothetical protein